jgi:hypothetical protein
MIGVDADPAILARARAKSGRKVEFDEGPSTELPNEDESFDVVLSTQFFHHLSDRAKPRSAQEPRRVLRRAGRLVIGGVGRPQNPLTRMAVLLTVQILDGFDVTSSNVAGRGPATLREAGLEDVTVPDRLRAPIETLEIVTARRRAPVNGVSRRRPGSPQTRHSMVAGVSGAVAEVRSSEKASAARRSPSSDTSGIAVLRLGSSAGCLSVRASRTPADPPASVMHYRRALERTETSFPARRGVRPRPLHRSNPA